MSWPDCSELAVIPRPDAPRAPAEVIQIPTPIQGPQDPAPAARAVLPEAAPRDRGTERAARLARLRAGLPAPEPVAGMVAELVVAPAPRRDPAAEDAARLAEFGRLPGVGPGLAWALARAGLADLAALAELDAPALAARLGPVGRLVPAAAWITAARAGSGREEG